MNCEYPDQYALIWSLVMENPAHNKNILTNP